MGTQDTFGLLHYQENRFYLVGDDHHSVKLVQFILLEQQFFVCVNLNKLSNQDLVAEINNKNCYNYGCTSTIRKYASLDNDPSMPGLKEAILRPGEPDTSLIANVLYLYQQLTKFENFFHSFSMREKERFRDIKLGLDELDKFVTLISGADENLKNFIEIEKSTMDQATERLQPIRENIIRSLVELDYFDVAVQSDIEKIFQKVNPQHIGNLSEIWSKNG